MMFQISFIINIYAKVLIVINFLYNDIVNRYIQISNSINVFIFSVNNHVLCFIIIYWETFVPKPFIYMI